MKDADERYRQVELSRARGVNKMLRAKLKVIEFELVNIVEERDAALKLLKDAEEERDAYREVLEHLDFQDYAKDAANVLARFKKEKRG